MASESSSNNWQKCNKGLTSQNDLVGSSAVYQTVPYSHASNFSGKLRGALETPEKKGLFLLFKD